MFRCEFLVIPLQLVLQNKGVKLNLVIWDIESSNANTDFGSIIQLGGILVDENFKEKDRFNLRCRLPEGEIPQCMALIVNRTSVEQLTKVNLGHYQMLGEEFVMYGYLIPLKNSFLIISSSNPMFDQPINIAGLHFLKIFSNSPSI